MDIIPIPHSLKSYQGVGKAQAKLRYGKIVQLYYGNPKIITQEDVLKLAGRKRWCEAAERTLAELKEKYHPTGDRIVICGAGEEVVSGSVGEFGYQVSHGQSDTRWDPDRQAGSTGGPAA